MTDDAISAAGERDSGAQDKPSAHTPSNEAIPTPAAAGDAAERPAVAATADRATESTEAALRLVDHLSRIPLAGPLLLLWTHTHEFIATVAQLGPVAANGGVKEVGETRPECVDDDQLSISAGAPAACTIIVGDQHVDEADTVRDSIVAAQSLMGEAGDDQLRINADAPVACTIVVGDQHIDEADTVRDSIVDDQALVGEVGALVSESVAGDEGGGPEPGAAPPPGDDGGVPVAIEAHGDDGRRPGDSGDASEARDVIIAGAVLERPAHRRRRRARAPRAVVAWLVRRGVRRPVDLGTLGPRGPPAPTHG